MFSCNARGKKYTYLNSLNKTASSVFGGLRGLNADLWCSFFPWLAPGGPEANLFWKAAVGWPVSQGLASKGTSLTCEHLNVLQLLPGWIQALKFLHITFSRKNGTFCIWCAMWRLLQKCQKPAQRYVCFITIMITCIFQTQGIKEAGKNSSESFL